MRVLIGTPIHQIKDYSMKKWMQNVSKLQRKSPADLLLVDNSPSTDYVEKVTGYCKKYGIKNCTIEHFEIDQGLGPDIRIERSQEIIRQYVLAHDYDAWFSWECDQIIPPDALNKLINLMEAGNFTSKTNIMMVIHDSKARWDPSIPNTNMGVTLIKKECLKKGWFLPLQNGKISLSGGYNIHEAMFKKRVLSAGGNYIEAYGIIKPIYHLKNS